MSLSPQRACSPFFSPRIHPQASRRKPCSIRQYGYPGRVRDRVQQSHSYDDGKPVNEPPAALSQRARQDG
eukprot:scaffold7614_cov417-Prasinococcus_capsulatus_cf.AAC.2